MPQDSSSSVSVQGAAEATDKDDAGGHGFWTSLKGIVTTVTALVAAVTTLVGVLHNAGLIGKQTAPAASENTQIAQETASVEPAVAVANELPRATSAADSSPVEAPAPDLRPFSVLSPGDGFAFVRAQPTVRSDVLTRVDNGTRLACGTPVEDASGVTGRFWRHCPDARGYVAAKLLVP